MSETESQSQNENEKDRTVHKEMDVEGSLIFSNWRLLDSEKKLIYDIEKCVGCSLCSIVCPEQAIELGPIPEIAQGLIEDTPAVLIDTEKCSFCMMCDAVCINSVYTVTDEKGDEIDKSEYPKLKPLYEWDEASCKYDESNEICIKCTELRSSENLNKGRHQSRNLKEIVDKCPTHSIKFNSPLHGEVILLKSQLHRCDPNGCKACVNICPTESFFIPSTAEEITEYGKIACKEDNCIYCGACENACPEKLIIVKRDSIDLDYPKDSERKPWFHRWKKQFERLTLDKKTLEELDNKTPKPIVLDEDLYVEEDVESENISPMLPFSKEEHEELVKENSSKLDKLRKILSKSNIRYFIHKRKLEKIKKIVDKELGS